MRDFLEYAILAPSSHNTQPWRFILHPEGIDLYGDKTRSLPIVDPQGRELIISCGAALAHLCLAIRNSGYLDKVKLFPDAQNTDWLATINLGASYSPTAQEKELFFAIPRRHTYRLPFQDKSIPETVIEQLKSAVTEYGVELSCLQTDNERQQVIQLIVEGDRIQMANPAFRQELGQWIKSSREKEGIPPYALGISEWLDWITPIFRQLLKTVDLGKMQGKKDAKLALEAPLLVVLVSKTDTPKDWVATGQALSQLLLTACSQGILASFLNQPIEVSSLRPQLQAILNTPYIPQLLLRLGYAQGGKPTPRRSVGEVVEVKEGRKGAVFQTNELMALVETGILPVKYS